MLALADEAVVIEPEQGAAVPRQGIDQAQKLAFVTQSATQDDTPAR